MIALKKISHPVRKGILIYFGLLFTTIANAQNVPQSDFQKKYWNSNLMLTAFRLPPPPLGYKPTLVDLDKDGDPDIIYSITKDNVPVLWIDDDDDMKFTDLEGDTDSDCLLIDKNKDGKYAAMGDMIIDWVDNNNDQKADMQIVVDYPEERTEEAWPNGHYMVVLDTDKDNIMNYIDWNTFTIKAWDRSGVSDFLLDYSGQSAFLKIHVATYTMDNLKLNWENPFLFYDPDHDGLTEMAVRFVDNPKRNKYSPDDKDTQNVKMTGKINWVSIGVDMDNDNSPGNEFDLDMAINFRGPGFSYMDQVHQFKNMKGLAAADTFFLDSRWRKLDELIYPDHNSGLDLIFNRGKWDQVYFVYDEDDDCNRWERVEFYNPLDMFKSGPGNGGLDDNVQSDVTGDRGEWDLDNSGKGQLYISKFDGRIHLNGAEWGAWRIDQNATFYHGGQRNWQNKETQKFSSVKYLDTDKNGFIDKILYDLDGDKQFEDSLELKKINIDDRCTLYDISKFKYTDYENLQKKAAEGIWQNSQLALKVATKYNLNTLWYAKWMQMTSIREKYHKGYWLQFYIYKDLQDKFRREENQKMLLKLDQAYYSANWSIILNLDN